MQLDWSKGCSLHSLYGHAVFAMEAAKAKKSDIFIANVCTNLRCFGGVPESTMKGRRV